MEGLKIGPLAPCMAEEILHIHHSAVHEGKAPDFYSQDILNNWSPTVTGERIDNFRNRMEGDGAKGVIAHMGKDAVGFGIFVPSMSMVGAVYVKASFAGKGIGGMILERLEEIALEHGCYKVFLDASLNARIFYQDHGYVIVEEGFHTLPSELKMECIKMEKVLEK